jgi:flagellar biosynthesis protein FlhA
MSNSSSNTLALLIALGAGALVGLSASSQKPKLPQIGGPRPSLDAAQPLPAVELALGSALVEAGGQLRENLGQVPQAIRNSLGFGPAGIAVKEDIDLPHEGYAVRLRGLTVASGQVRPDRLFALGAHEDVAGDQAELPVGSRKGVWIAPQDAGQARLMGYDVLEPGFVLALHVDTVLRRHLHELLTREETYRLLDRAKQQAPRTIEELTTRLETGRIQKVLQALLREQVSLRDLPMVLELLSDAAAKTQEPEALIEEVRAGLARQLSAALAGDDAVLHVLPLGPRWEQLRNAQPGDAGLRDLVGQLRRQVDDARDHNLRPVLVAPRELRAAVRRMIERDLPDLPVLSEAEVDPAFKLQPIASLQSV